MNARTLFALPAAMLVAAASAASPLRAQQNAIGEWHGALAAPTGPMMLAIRIRANADTGLAGDLIAVDQAPNRKLPLSIVLATDQKLSFTVPSLAATYDAEWNAATREWRGTFRQGMTLPLVLKSGPPPANPIIVGMDGTWRASLKRDTATLRLILYVATTALRGTRVTLDSPDLGSFGLPVEAFSKDGDRVRFTVPLGDVQFDGTLATTARTLSGTWMRQGSPPAQVTFAWEATPTPTKAQRTQWPVKPAGYRAIDVKFANASAHDVTLAGTLTLPDATQPVPAVVLISGSGAQDRDESTWGHKPFAVLADHLSKRGIAVLRYDDRGFAASTGNHNVATSADFATDADAAIRYLMSRPEIDAKAIGLVGHSEGGMIGPIAADGSNRVAFVVLLAGPGTSTVRLMLAQREAMAAVERVSPQELAPSQAVIERVMRAVASTPDSARAASLVNTALTPEALAALGATDSLRSIIVAQYTAPWMRYFLRYDAPKVLARLRVPVLAINGSKDVQVPAAENLAGIRLALSRNRDVTVKELPGLNHMFQPATTGAVGEYNGIAETFSPAAMDMIADWVRERFARKAPPSR